MGSLSIGYSTRALFGITKWQSKEGLSGDCWRKGRFEVHVLLRLFANEQVHRATQFRVLAFAEVGDTVTADHLLWPPWQLNISLLCLASVACAYSIQFGMHNSDATELACLVPTADNGPCTYAPGI